MLTRDDIIAEACRWEGTPYRHQSSLRGIGADCLGLIRGVYRGVIGPELFEVPPYRPYPVRGQGEELLNAAQRVLVPCRDIKPGTIAFFRFRPLLPAHHASIFISQTLMIHAVSSRAVCRVGVHPWWQRRIAALFDFPGIGDD